METPPQFPGAPKKSKTGLILGILALAVVLCCCGCGGYAIYFFKNNAKGLLSFAGCGLTMAEDRDALLAYAEDHKGLLPPAKNWQNSIKPYVSNDPSVQDANIPIEIPGPDDDFCDKAAGTAITYNAEIAGKKLADIKDKGATIAFFESAGREKSKSAAWAEPLFEASPVMMMSQKRGWIRQPLEGNGGMKDKNGNLTPLDMGSRRRGARAKAKATTGNDAP